MSDNLKISNSEYDVMEVIWRLGCATVAQVQSELSDKNWAYNTVATFMTRLSDKGLLSSRTEGKAKIYSPQISRDMYKRELTEDFLNSIHRGSKRSLIAALFENSVSDEVLDKLIDELDRR